MVDYPSIGGALSDVYHDAFRRLWDLMKVDLLDALDTNTSTQVWVCLYGLVLKNDNNNLSLLMFYSKLTTSFCLEWIS